MPEGGGQGWVVLQGWAAVVFLDGAFREPGWGFGGQSGDGASLGGVEGGADVNRRAVGLWLR